MAIRTSIQPRQLWKNLIGAILCAAFGVWGWYDYSVTIPAREQAFEEFTALTKAKDALEAKRAKNETLTAAEVAEYERINKELDTRFLSAPTPVPAYDRPVQLWVYVVGCGVLGTPMFLWPLFSLRRKQYALEDDGTLRFPEGTCRMDEVSSIDMSRWMAKSIAVVTLPSGATSLLDDYKYKGLDRIIGAIAHRLHPDEWTPEAKPVKAEEPDESEAAAEDAEGQEVEVDGGDAGSDSADRT